MFLILFFICLGIISSSELQIEKKYKFENYCYATDQNTYKYFATKTEYDFVHKDDDIKDCLRDCTPVYFWSLNRHGTRLPGKKAIKDLEKLTAIQRQIINNYENEVPNGKANRLCEQDLQLFKNWVWNKTINEDIATFLTLQGWNELKNLAIRNKKKYPEILEIGYSKKDYLFRYTRHERTESSFKSYVQGLFNKFENVHGISFENDTLIETYKHCELWEKTVDNNPETYEEYDKFTQTKIFQQLILEVSKRLGFENNLDIATITNFFDMCRYDQAWYPKKKSTWCAAFTKQHLKLLEYAEDLRYYYDTGHGTELNRKVGCMPLQDLMRRFENVVNGLESEPKSVHYFTHSASLQLLMATMGIMKDEFDLTADNWNKQSNRLWRTSFISPFAANINAVLYKCATNDKYRVMFYLNERKYEFLECPNNGICSWKVVKKMFSKIADNCNLDFCKNNE